MDTLIECIGEVLPDGQVSLPEAVRQQLVATAPHAQLHLTIKVLASTPPAEQAAWDALLHMGEDASSGRLPDASTTHDQYLYRKES